MSSSKITHAILTASLCILWADQRAWAAEEEPLPIRIVDEAEVEALVPVLYERMHDPADRESVRFIGDVRLVARPDGASAQSQYLICLIPPARKACFGLYFQEVQRVLRDRVSSDEKARGLRKRDRARVLENVDEKVFGRLMSQVMGGGDHERGTWDGGLCIDDEYTSPTPETPGQVAMKTLDESLRDNPDKMDLIQKAIGTVGIQWEFLDHEVVTPARFRTFIDSGFPFVLHLPTGAVFICGYAQYEANPYLMGFVLDDVEISVSLQGSVGGMPYSSYRRLLEDNEARERVKDYSVAYVYKRAFFSIKNLECFRLLRADGSASITALWAAGVDTPVIENIVSAALEPPPQASPNDQRDSRGGPEPGQPTQGVATSQQNQPEEDR
jgi:hypothetical protein